MKLSPFVFNTSAFSFQYFPLISVWCCLSHHCIFRLADVERFLTFRLELLTFLFVTLGQNDLPHLYSSVLVLGAADRNDRFLQRMKTKVDLSVVDE